MRLVCGRGHLPGIGVHGHGRSTHLYLSPSEAQVGANSAHGPHLAALSLCPGALPPACPQSCCSLPKSSKKLHDRDMP